MYQPEFFYFLYAPDAGSLSETFLFKTTIFASLALVETRKSLLDDYKLKCSFSITIDTVLDVQNFNSVIGNRNDNILMPIWTQAKYFKNATSSSDKIYMDTTEVDYRVNDTLIIFEPDATSPKYQVVVEEVDPTYIKVNETVNIEAGDYLAPIRLGKLAKSISSSHLRGASAKYNISFEEY